MSEGLSEEDIKKIAEALAQIEDKDDSRGFRVKPEAHYNSHARIDRFLDSYDNASNLVVKFFIGLCLLGLVTAGAIGAGWNK